MKKGLNNLLYKKRVEYSLSLREAAKLLKITSLELYLIERGYITRRKKLEDRFIGVYHLEPSFFKDDSYYPEVVNSSEETKYPKFITKFVEFIHKPTSRIIFGVSAVLLIGLSIGGLTINHDASNNPQRFFSDEILSTREMVIEKGVLGDKSHDTEFTSMILDVYYTYQSILEGENKMQVSLNFFSREDNIQYSFLKGEKNYYIGEGQYTFHYEARAINKYWRVKSTIYYDNNRIAYIAADVNNSKTNIYDIYKVNEDHEIIRLYPGDAEYDVYCGLFKGYYPYFWNSVKEFFETDAYLKANCNYDTFIDGMYDGVKEFETRKMSGSIMFFVGVIFSLICIAFAASFILKRKTIDDFVEEEVAKRTIEVETTIKEKKHKIKPKEKLKPNWKIGPFLPEFFLKLLSIALIFAGSIGLYVIFSKVFELDILGIIKWVELENEFKSLTIIGLILMFFFSLNITQYYKNRLVTNFALFFLGLGYYVLLLYIKDQFNYSAAAVGVAGQIVASLLPGNIIWGLLAFNLFVMFLFYTPDRYKNNKKAIIRYRLLVILPILYLLASCILTIGKKSLGWKIPFEIFSLFFSKSLLLVTFALLFVFAIFIYKLILKKKYSKEDAEVYLLGNKHYFVKNIIASVIVLLLGITEIIFHVTGFKNKLGLGSNYLVLLAIPFILFAHPHIGKKNPKVELPISILNGVALSIGIVLIAFNIIVYLFKI